MFLRIFVFFSVYLTFYISGKSQFSNQDVKEKFNYEIIQVEEFIERFNFDNNTKLLQYLNSNNPDLMLERKVFMTSLFDQYGNQFDNKQYLVNGFIDFVCNENNPKFLSFYDGNWYAEVECILEFQDQQKPARLTLVSQVDADSSSKWVIAGVQSDLLNLPESKDSLRIMTPVSHGTGFISLHNIFKDGENVKNYLQDDFSPDELTSLALMMYFNTLKLIEVSEITYHFLQIPHYVFTLEYINRKELNSGWLITNLFYMNQNEKKEYKKDKLNIN